MKLEILAILKAAFNWCVLNHDVLLTLAGIIAAKTGWKWLSRFVDIATAVEQLKAQNAPVNHDNIAAKVRLSGDQVREIVKVRQGGNVVVDKVALAGAVVNSGDFKKMSRKFKKFIKKI